MMKFLLFTLVARILSLAGVAHGQQFSDVLLGHGYPGLSEKCANALNTTLKDCPGFLASASINMPRLDSSSLDALCTSDCQGSLISVRRVIDAGCSAKRDVVEIGSVVYPATFMIDRMLYTYNVSCTKDSDTGKFCDEIYSDALANGTAADSCSDCSLNTVRMQLNSPFGYHPEFADGFRSITSKCGATGYAFTSPTRYAISSKPSAAPTDSPSCETPYTVQEGDSCDSIAAAKNVSSHSVANAARTGPDCNTLRVGAKLCLPQPCTVYRVKYDETCQDILDSVSGLRASDLLVWNPSINALCTNMDTMFRKYICISPPGRTLDEVTSVSTTPTTTQPPETPVPRPSNAKQESNERCAGWYEVKNGDDCQAISVRQGISLRDFLFLNPAVNATDCSNLWLKTSYCVRPVGDINTYSGYPYSTSPIYTLTSSNYVTTTAQLVKPVPPIATPLVELPLAEGSASAEDGCFEFAQWREVVPQQDQSVQVDVPRFTKTINACDYVSASFGVSLSEFLTWNPSLEGLDPCQLQEGLRYCGRHRDAEEAQPPANSTCFEVAEPYPGTVSSCSCFTTIQGYDVGLYTCEDLVHDKNITLSDLVSWNPWIGDESDCDTGIYADLGEADERPVCVGVGDGGGGDDSTTSPSPTTTSGTA